MQNAQRAANASWIDGKGMSDDASIQRSAKSRRYALHCASAFPARARTVLLPALFPRRTLQRRRPGRSTAHREFQLCRQQERHFEAAPKQFAFKANFAISASGASVPLTRTIESPRSACTRRTGSLPEKNAATPARKGERLARIFRGMPRRYICCLARMRTSRSPSRLFLLSIEDNLCRNFPRQRRSRKSPFSEGLQGSVPSTSKKPMFMPAPWKTCALVRDRSLAKKCQPSSRTGIPRSRQNAAVDR